MGQDGGGGARLGRWGRGQVVEMGCDCREGRDAGWRSGSWARRRWLLRLGRKRGRKGSLEGGDNLGGKASVSPLSGGTGKAEVRGKPQVLVPVT